jgi:hypothetical protein
MQREIERCDKIMQNNIYTGSKWDNMIEIDCCDMKINMVMRLLSDAQTTQASLFQ